MTPSSRRKLGLALIVTPPVLVFLAIILFAIISFIVSMTAATTGLPGPDGFVSQTSGGAVVFARIANAIIGFMGFLGMIGMITALPIGLFLFFATPKSVESPTGPILPPKT